MLKPFTPPWLLVTRPSPFDWLWRFLFRRNVHDEGAGNHPQLLMRRWDPIKDDGASDHQKLRQCYALKSPRRHESIHGCCCKRRSA
jgi:hypothetical protein